MRKTLLAFFVALQTILPMQAKQITQQLARQQAAAFMQQHGMTVSAGATSMAKSAVTGTTSATGTASCAAYYAFNDESGKGFVIISGDDRTDAVLGYSDSGTYNEDSLPENMKAWLQGYVRQIRYIDSLGITSEAAAKAKSSALTVAVHKAVAPMIKTKWDQGAPYNNLCPLIDGKQCATGCVATAMAQVMYYYQYPQDVTAGIPAYIDDEDTSIHRDSLPPVKFEWDKMPLENTDVDNSIATLMEYCGHALKMSYGVYGSSSFDPYIPSALSDYFGYDKGVRLVYRMAYTISSWDNLIYNELAGGRPVIYGGTAYNWGGHTFVCDGYDGNGLYHINWGWSGLYDGYFKLSVLQPYSSEDYTDTNHDGFNYKQNAVIGIQKPNGGEAEQKIHLDLYQVKSSNDGISITQVNDGAKNIFDIGYAVLKSDGSLDVIAKGTISLVTGQSATLLIRSSNIHLTAGVYNLVSVSRVYGTETWYNTFEGTKYSIKAVVNYAGKVTLTLYPNINPVLTVVSDSVVGSRLDTWKQYLHLAVNSQGGEYNGNLYLFVSKTDTLGNYVNMVGTAIEEDSTENIVISFVPAETGTYHLWVATDEAGQNIIYQDSVDIISATGIEETSTDSDAVAPYYTLQGFRLDARPTQKGLYIRKGKTVVVK